VGRMLYLYIRVQVADLLGDSVLGGGPSSGADVSVMSLLSLSDNRSPVSPTGLVTMGAPRPPVPAYSSLGTLASSLVSVPWTSSVPSSSLSSQPRPVSSSSNKPASSGRYDSLDALSKNAMQQAKNGGGGVTGSDFGDMVQSPSQQQSVDILPLTDVTVQLESIQPGQLTLDIR
jgi:hypothetical protein